MFADVSSEGLAEVARALESETRSVTGNGLRFAPARLWIRSLGPSFALGEHDALGSFPGVGAVVGVDTARPAPASPCLALGRDAMGRVAGPPTEPGQGRHLAVVGETGMGKSSLLVALARRASESAGLVLLDPLGETAAEVRDLLAHDGRNDVLWMDPSGPLGLNALGSLGPSTPRDGPDRERQLNDLVHALRRVRSGRYADAGFWGPRLEEMLTRALDAAASLPGGTLTEAHALLAAEGRGFRQVPAEAQEPVRALADRIRTRPEDADGARRLLFEVTRSPTLVRLLCASAPTVTAADLVRPGRVVLLAGNASEVGESVARYFLAVLLALLWSELLHRPGTSKTWVVLDEAQWFAHDSLAEMLRLGRRKNVHVVLATQAIGSLPEPVAESVWTNVADFAIFRGSPADALQLSRSLESVTPESIFSLAPGRALLLIGKGERIDWVRTARSPRTAHPGASDVGATAVAGNPRPPCLGVEPTLRSLTPEGAVWQAVVDQARAAPPGARLRVSLPSLRADVDPSGEAVRVVGQSLRTMGALLGTGRDAAGSFWWVDAGRIAARDGEAGPPRRRTPRTAGGPSAPTEAPAGGPADLPP
jgi:energy-coupling factor transporter ATP-binding protein EcfA2